ncbi:MAG: hypothetical protein M1826_007112 [Phylliscum demangeonii]|nr:MAG: hypothetical protein M1826_007112 [Phylliscum demangeonii]
MARLERDDAVKRLDAEVQLLRDDMRLLRDMLQGTNKKLQETSDELRGKTDELQAKTDDHQATTDEFWALKEHTVKVSSWLFTLAAANASVDLARWVRSQIDSARPSTNRGSVIVSHSSVRDLDYVRRLGREAFQLRTGLSGEVFDVCIEKGAERRQDRNQIAHDTEKKFAQLLMTDTYGHDRHVWTEVFPKVYGKSLEIMAAEQDEEDASHINT